jgi:polysaccharide chain length determinant protein (PEP-CTERM system associated)
MAEEAQGRSAGELVREVWSRRKWLALAALAVPLAATVSLVAFMPSLYRSTVLVLVDRQQVPEAFVRPTVTSALEIRLQSISQEILSRSRLDALISQFGLYPDLKQRMSAEEVIERMRRDIQLELKSVDQKDGGKAATIAFALSYRGRDPQAVAQVTNTLASFYIEENLKARERQATGTAEFLKVQLTGVKSRLDEQDRVLSDFKKKNLGELPQQLDANLATIERLNAQLRATGDSQTRAVERREALLRQLADAGALGGTGPDAIEEQIAKLNQELMQLRARYSEKYPDVIRVRGEIATLERELSDKQSGKQPAPARDSKAVAGQTPYVLRTKQALADVEAEINILKSDEKRVRSAIAAYLGRVENVPRREQEYKELSRDYDSMRENYASLQKRYEEAQLAESMEQRQKGEQFRVLDPAIPTWIPAAPNRLRLLAMGVALSLGLAAALVVGAEQLNAAFHSVDDLRAFTSVPVLVSIPLIVTAADTARSRRQARLAATTAAVALVIVVGGCYLLAHGNDYLVTLLSSPGRTS